MPRDDKDLEETREMPGFGAGYAQFQLGRALTTATEHADPAARQRALDRIGAWHRVLSGMLSGALDPGSRTPLREVPAWATLQVMTGGFATGELLAEGPILPHERALLARFSAVPETEARRVLNAFYLSDEGLAMLTECLKSGGYQVTVPEEGALLVVAWLLKNGHADEARALLDTLGAWLSRLRFYPGPGQSGSTSGSRVFVETVGQAIARLEDIRPNERVLAQREAVMVWTPLYDRMVALFLETVDGAPPTLRREADGRIIRKATGAFEIAGAWPCRRYPPDFSVRGQGLLDEYQRLRGQHRRCKDPDRKKSPFAKIRKILRQAIQDPRRLTGRDVGALRLILAGYVSKRGAPDSDPCRAARAKQQGHARAPTLHELAPVLTSRLRTHPEQDGLDDLVLLDQPVSPQEARTFGLPEGVLMPETLRTKAGRCRREAPLALVLCGLIPSGETLARVLPQMTSDIRAAGFSDPALRRLRAAIDAAFRRRRSLLLLNLEKQVQLEELPWVAALEPYRSKDLAARDLAWQTLDEVAGLAIRAFPQAILPNKLVGELKTLQSAAGLHLPLVEEVAADIFMGEFSGKFLEAAKVAATLLDKTLYALYYAIDFEEVRGLQHPEALPKQAWHRKAPRRGPFVALCARRAGVELGGWDPAKNGMIIEQQQILTTQNLAVLFANLRLSEVLGEGLAELPKRCFTWVCKRLQVKTDRFHARLIQVKNAAYAWRQMLFFLALLPELSVIEFLLWAEEHLSKQPEAFRVRFFPAFQGLLIAAQGQPVETNSAAQGGARPFLGWSKDRHWLLSDLHHDAV